MNHKKAFYLLLIAIITTLTSIAQTSSIRGFVYEKETGEPLYNALVYIENTKYKAAADINGHFMISKLHEGTYNLIITSMGFDTMKATVSLAAGEILNKKYYLSSLTIMLKESKITASRQVSKTETKTSLIKISPSEINSIPSIGGQADLAQYIQVLPGVVFTGDQGGQIYIRGGSPIQNKVLLDGMVVYNPFHSIGLFSVFDTDILKNIDVYTGGFGAEYGGRISSIMDITTRDGNKKRWCGKVSTNTFGAHAILEGPLKKSNDNDDGSSSIILSFKNSYLKQSSKLFYKYIDTAGLPFNFSDYYGKLSFNATNGSKVNVFGFNFTDNVQYKVLSNFDWKASGGGLNFVLIPGESDMLLTGNFAYSSYNIKLVEGNLDPRSSDIDGFNTGLTFTYFLQNGELKYGFEVLGFNTNFNYFNDLKRKIEQTDYTTEAATYLKYRLVKKNLVFEPSLRLHYYASLSSFSPEPRLAIKYNISNSIRVKLASGMYTQNLISATSDRDVVNLFYGFLSGPDKLQDKFDGKEITDKLQHAQHLILGFEFDLTNSLSLNIEGYLKNFSQLTNLNRNKIYDDELDNPDNYDKPDYLKNDFIVEKGLAKGVELSVKYTDNRIFFNTSYSLSSVDRNDGMITYPTNFDRRHNINSMLSYKWGKNNNWSADLRWNFGSGFPFSQTQGYYESMKFDGGINTDYTTSNGDLNFVLAGYNQGRLPYYHRLDFNLKRQFIFTRNSKLEINFTIINVYNRDNIFYFDRIQYQRIDQLPFLPSLGISLTF